MRVKLSFEMDEAKAAKSIVREMNRTVFSRAKRLAAAAKLEDIIKQEFSIALLRNVTWASVRGSDPQGLDADFGIPRSQNAARTNAISNKWIDSIKVTTNLERVGGREVVGFTVYGIMADYSDVKSMSEATVTSRKGFDIEWIEWLLEKGNSKIITGWEVSYGSYPDSRSGKAIMVKEKSSFSVPPEHSGRADNNFMTRMINELTSDNDFKFKVESAIKNALS